MIDIFALALTHSLMLLGIWRMIFRADFDGDLAEPTPGEEPPGA